MWSRDRTVGNVYSRCPRAGPAPSRRLVHMSTAWLLRVSSLLWGSRVSSWVGQCRALGSAPNRSAALRVKRARV